MSDACKRCDGSHDTRECRAPIKKCWIGQWRFKGTIVTPDGSWLEFEMPLGDEGRSLLDRLTQIACDHCGKRPA